MKAINRIHEIVELNSSQNRDVIAFLDNALDRQVNEENWDWEFNTQAKTIFKIIKHETDGIIATQSMMPVFFLDKGVELLTYKSESSFIQKGFRGQHIFEDLYSNCVESAFENGARYVWGFTPATNAWKRNFGFNVEQNVISNVSIPIGRSRYDWDKNLFKNILKNMFYTPIILINRIKINNQIAKCTMKIKSFSGVQFEGLNILNYEFLKEKNYIGIDLNEDYIQWRLNSNPFVNYETLNFYRDEFLVGSIIYSRNSGNVNITNVLFKSEDDINPGIHLFFDFLRKVNVVNCSYWGNKNNETNKLIFRAFATKLRVRWSSDISRTLVNKSKDGLEIDSRVWYINALWTEGVCI
jgi:hypothetical protein